MIRPEKTIREMIVILEAFGDPAAVQALRWVLGELGVEEGLPSHPEVSEQSTQDQRDLTNLSRMTWSLLRESAIALHLARDFIAKELTGHSIITPLLETTIFKVEQFLADPQQVERDAAKCLVGGCLQAPVSGNRICPEHQDVLGITEDSNA